MKEPNVVLRFISCVAVAACLACVAYYLTKEFVPEKTETITEDATASPNTNPTPVFPPPVPPGGGLHQMGMEPYNPVTNPLGTKPDLFAYALKENTNPQNILGVKRYLCVSVEDQTAEEDMTPPPLPETPIEEEKTPTEAEIKAEEAEMVRRDRKCDEGYEPHQMTIFPISRTAVPSDREKVILDEMAANAKRFAKKYVYTCVSAINLTEGEDYLAGISIPDFSDDPARINNLISPKVPGSGCREGYTYHSDTLLDIIPQGYHYDASWQLPAGAVEPQAIKQNPKKGGSEDSVRVDIHICKKIAKPSDDSEEDYSSCTKGFEDEGVAMFTLSRLIGPAPELEKKVTDAMKEVAEQFKSEEVYTCILAETQDDSYWAYRPRPVSIPGFSDKPAASGKRKHCPEGYTEHTGVLTQAVPEGYYVYDNKYPQVGSSTYRIIY